MEEDEVVPYLRKLSSLDDNSAPDQFQTYYSRKVYLTGEKYNDDVLGSTTVPLSFHASDYAMWRIKRKIKTQDIILVLCLNFEQLPEGSEEDCGMGDECWINLSNLTQKKNTFHYIALTLQKQYENQLKSSIGMHSKHMLDPSLTNLETVCEELRASNDKGTQNRVLFHYNGHGVPPPSELGEIWVFNKKFDKYKPVPISLLHSWLRSPTMYVMDCSHAGSVLQHIQELSGDSIEDDLKNVYFLGACDICEVLPTNPDFPADIFTACLTDPIRISIRFFLYKRNLYPFSLLQELQKDDNIEEDYAYRLEGDNYNRDLPKGKLRMIFDCITDSIAFNALGIELYKELFKTDEMVASLFRNFLLAQRVLSYFACHPVSKPHISDLAGDDLWKTWDSVLEDFLHQYLLSQKSFNTTHNLELYRSSVLANEYPIDYNDENLLKEIQTKSNLHKYPHIQAKQELKNPSRNLVGEAPSAFVNAYGNNSFVFHTLFFNSTLRDLHSYVTNAANVKMLHPCFSMLAQLLNSDEITQKTTQDDSINVIEVLADFSERSYYAVYAILATVNFASLKRISVRAQRQHRKALLRLWVQILSFDYRVQEDLMQNLFLFVVSFLRQDADPIPTEEDIIRAEFILSVACHENELARVKCKEAGVHQTIRRFLRASSPLLRRFTCILLNQLCYESNELKEYIFYDSSMSDILSLLEDANPDVRAAALLLLQSFVGFGSTDPGATTGSIHVYLTKEEIENLVMISDPSAHRDIVMVENIYKKVIINSEGSVLVRRELLRLILKVLSRRVHMAKMICFVDRVMKSDVDVNTLLEDLKEGRTIKSSKRKNSRDHDINSFYLKYWIMMISIRDSEPHPSIRKAAAHYVNIICKNVDSLKSKGSLPITPSIFDFNSLLQRSTSLNRGSIHRPTSITSLPTIPSPRDSSAAATSTRSSRDLTGLPLLSTSTNHLRYSSNSSIPIVNTSALPVISTSTPFGVTSDTPEIPQVTTARPSSSKGLARPSHPAIIPQAIKASPSFTNLQLVNRSSASQEIVSHLDTWLEVQLGVLGLPHTLTEWSINEYSNLQNGLSTKENSSVKVQARKDAVSDEEYTALDYRMKRMDISVRRRTMESLQQIDMFHTDGGKINCMCFNPMQTGVAIGVNNTVMVYDYEEKKQIYALDSKLSYQSSSLLWMNPVSSSPLLVQATQKGTIHIWDVPDVEKKQQPRIVSSFLAFPAFAKNPSSVTKTSVVCEWNQSNGFLATGGSTQMVRIWDMEKERLVDSKETGFHVPVIALASVSFYTYIGCISNGNLISFDLRMKPSTLVYSVNLPANNRLVDMSIASTGSIIIGDFEGNVAAIDPRVFKVNDTWKAGSQISGLKAHPILPYIASSSFASELRIQDMTGKSVRSIRALDGFRNSSLGYLQGVCMHPFDTTTACYNTDGVVYIYQ